MQTREDSLDDILDRLDPPGQEYDNDTDVFTITQTADMLWEFDEHLLYIAPDMLIDIIDGISESNVGRVYM